MAKFTPVESPVFRNVKNVRAFDAFLEVVESVDDMLDMQPVSGEDDWPPCEGELYPVIGFNISCAENKIPTATVSLPVGQYLTNLSGRYGGESDNYRSDFTFEPIEGIDSGIDLAMDSELEDKLAMLGVILWCRIPLNDNDIIEENRQVWKQIFKGVTSMNSFTRIAYAQESFDVKLNHWAYILDTVMVQNALVDTISEASTFGPAMRVDPSMRLEVGSDSKSGPNREPDVQTLMTSGELLAGQSDNPNVGIFNGILQYLKLETEISEDYPIAWKAYQEKMKKVYEAGLKLVKETCEDLLERHKILVGQGYSTLAEFKQDNVYDGQTLTAFRKIAVAICDGQFNGLTYLQAMEAMAAEACLTMVYTANSVTMEALAYRPKTWKFAGKDKEQAAIDYSTQIVSNKTFAREIIGLVGHFRVSKEIAPADKEGESEPWASHIYYDVDAASEEDIAPGSAVMVSLPDWFNASHGNNTEPYISSGTRFGALGGENVPIQSRESIPVDVEAGVKKVNNLLKLMYYQLKAKNRSVRVTLPFEINTCIGMPVCVKDSRHGLYYSGIVTAFDHNLSRNNDTAQTVWTLGSVEAFPHADKNSEPEENPNDGADDNNPLYGIAGFTGRPIYE